MTRKLLTALVACGVFLAAAGSAAADSIVFIKDRNLWVAGSDGSGARAVTTDGTADAPYWSPSQADDGTIAVAHYDRIELWSRDGTKLRELDPPPLTDSVSHPVDGAVAKLAISPDAQTIAFNYAQWTCPPGASCAARATMGYMPTSGSKPPSDYADSIYLRHPSWVTNTRTLAFGGYGSQVNLHDLGPGTSAAHWFDDEDVVGPEYQSTDLGDGELNRQGTKLALVRSYGSDTHVMWYTVNGDALSGPPPADPTMACATGKLEGLHSPTWSPGGDALGWAGPEGIYTVATTATQQERCADVQPKLTIPGGSEPDWGPADPGVAKPPEAKQETQVQDQTDTQQPVQELVTVRLARKLRFKGFTATVTPWTAGRISAVVKAGGKTLLKGAATAKAAGNVKVRLKPAKKGRSIARRKRKLKARLTVTFTPAGGTARRVVRSVRLVR